MNLEQSLKPFYIIGADWLQYVSLMFGVEVVWKRLEFRVLGSVV